MSRPAGAVGVISGSGSYDLAGLRDPRSCDVATPHGSARVTEGVLAGSPVAHLSRHGERHARLSNQVDHRANLAALIACEVSCVISLTVCGATDANIEPGSLIVFDDLYFPSNRLPDGSLCTWHTQPGAADRGHWIFDAPFSEPLRRILIEAARGLDVPLVEHGCYGHLDGPRFNSRAEVAALTGLGVTAISQTAGPEIVLAGEAELPYALVGFVTDYANGVGQLGQAPEPVDALQARMKHSATVFADLLGAALPRVGAPPASGIVYRFDG